MSETICYSSKKLLEQEVEGMNGLKAENRSMKDVSFVSE
jgi:hypothetical protein